MVLSWMPLAIILTGDSLATEGGECAALTGDREAWFEAAGETVTLPFRDLAVKGELVFVTDQYEDHGVLFTDGDDFITIQPSSYPNDGVGLNGFGSTITVLFDPPIYWVAVDLPACDPLILFSGGREILTADNCACTESACFIGTGSTIPIDKVVIVDSPSCPCIDDLHFSRTPITIDCNLNGIPDLIEVSFGCQMTPDCNGNLVPDECDVASGVAEDCDDNGVLDECEVAQFHTASEEHVPFGGPAGPTLTFTEQPDAGSDVDVSIAISADLDEAFEYIISVEFDGEVFGESFFVDDGLLCADPPQELHFTIPSEQYNAFIEDDGMLEVRARPTSTVDPYECDPSFVAAEISYFTLVKTDLNYNGIPDACEGAPGDVDGDGDVDFTDLLTLISAWGDCPPAEYCPADIDLSGSIGFDDLLLLLSNWS